MKLQQVEWFAFRRPEIANAQKAADRKAMIAALEENGDPLADDLPAGRRAGEARRRGGAEGRRLPAAVERGREHLLAVRGAGDGAGEAGRGDGAAGAFGDRVGQDGGAVLPVGSDGRAAAGALRLREPADAVRRAAPFFPAVDSRFKFCAFVAGRSPQTEAARCAFFLQALSEVEDPDRRLELTPDDFRRVNPNTGTAPIFRSRRDQEITTAIYRRLPVLVNRSSGEPVSAWPVKYSTMFHMTNDSHRFRTRTELEEKEGAWHVGGNLYDGPAGRFVPLYEGKMVQAFDHRAASVVVNPDNLHRPGQPVAATAAQHGNPDWVPDPQFWVPEADCEWPPDAGWTLGFTKSPPLPTSARSSRPCFPQSGSETRFRCSGRSPPSAANGSSPPT